MVQSAVSPTKKQVPGPADPIDRDPPEPRGREFPTGLPTALGFYYLLVLYIYMYYDYFLFILLYLCLSYCLIRSTGTPWCPAVASSLVPTGFPTAFVLAGRAARRGGG